MAVNIRGGSGTSGVANVTDFNLNVTLPTDADQSGFARIGSENDPGDITGTPDVKSPETETDYRLRVGIDTLQDSETFCYTAQNTGKHSYAATTMTVSLVSGFLTTNNTSITTASTGVSFRTWRYFPLFGQQTPIFVSMSALFTAAVGTNTTIDFGLFIPGAANPYAPTDGVFFRANSSGVFGVLSYNGVETTTAAFASFTITPNQVYQFLVTVTDREVKFWVDDVLYATLATQSGNGTPMAAQSAPWAVRHAIGGTPAGTAMQFKIADYSIFLGSMQATRPWGHVMSAMGNTMQVQQGATTGGQLSVYANGAAPGAVTLTANTAPATNNMGGLFLLPSAITTAESDYPLFAYLNPAGTAAIPGKTLVVTGLRIGELFVTTVLVGGPLMFQWAVGFGSTASSLATTETSSFTAGTTKVARRIAVGTQAIPATAAVGTTSLPVSIDFGHSPITVDPGCYFHVILRVIGTNLTSGAIRGSVTPIFHFE